MEYVLGLDLGTSSLKGLLVDRTGKIIGEASADYPLITPQFGFSEQNPQLWLEAAEKVIKEILRVVPDAAKKTVGISFSGQMHSLVLLDKNDKVLRNAILWNDVRTTKQCEEITKKLGSRLIEITKNRALEGFTLPKLLWVKQNEPEVWTKAEVFMLPKDYLGFWLTGNKQMEYSDAAGTLLLHIENKTWSKEILDEFAIPGSLCPKLVESTDCIGNVKESLMESLGFKGTVKVFAGGADNACAAIGAGILDEKTAMCSIGTSGVYLSYEENKKSSYNGQLHFFNHAIRDSYYSMGVTLSAGNSLTWFKNTFAPNESYDQLLLDIEDIPAGCDGLLFAPYIMGERTPYADSTIRGSFIGIDIKHTRDHFVRAVLEGITFSLKDSQRIMEEGFAKTADKIVSVGGGSKNKAWLQMQADIFDTQVVTLAGEQGPAFGAVIIAAVGSGWFNSFKDCANEFVCYSGSYKPQKAGVEQYKKAYKEYQNIYCATKEFGRN